MRDILDPADRWVGLSGRSLSNSNKRPVAINDILNVTKDSGPVTVNVLANDFDPEGQPLVLVDASAALGTAVAEIDNTVTYTPPSGITGFDTVVYTIADDLGQTRAGQVNVTILEPSLSISVAPDSTMTVQASTGVIDITITSPNEFSGNFTVDLADLSGGPINLIPPGIAGDLAIGNVLNASDGLWIHGTAAGSLTQSWQWRRGGVDIIGADSASYTVTADDLATGVDVVETLTDDFGQRSAASTTLTQSAANFDPLDDTQLIGWWDASDTASLTESGGQVSVWSDKSSSGFDLTQSYSPDQPITGTRSLNGLNVLDLGGLQHLLAPVTLPVAGDLALHFACIIDSTQNAFEAVLAIDATNDFQVDSNNASQFDGRLNTNGIGPPLDLTGGPFSGALILSVVFDRTGAAEAEVFISNQSRGSTPYTAALDSTAALHVMANRSRNASVNGAAAELILTGDISNRAAHHAYLATKWGLV